VKILKANVFFRLSKIYRIFLDLFETQKPQNLRLCVFYHDYKFSKTNLNIHATCITIDDSR